MTPETTLDEMKAMRLHDTMRLRLNEHTHVLIIRVPDGWIYTGKQTHEGRILFTQFVPEVE